MGRLGRRRVAIVCSGGNEEVPVAAAAAAAAALVGAGAGAGAGQMVKVAVPEQLVNMIRLPLSFFLLFFFLASVVHVVLTLLPFLPRIR